MTIDLDAITLQKGAHGSRETGVCVMEAVAWFAGEGHSDHPACTDAVVAAYARALNDRMPADQRQRLKPLIPLLAGTHNGASPEQRAYLCADRAVRVFAPMALRAAGCEADAARMEALPPITSAETARQAHAVAAAAASAADAEAAAYAAAAAAGAAGADAWDAAIDLLRDLCAMGAA